MQQDDLNKVPRADREYINIFIRAGMESNFYKREGYDLLTYLGDLGGLFDIVYIVGSIITGLLTSKIFTATLISQLYRIQNYMKDETQYYETKEHYKFTSECEESKSSSNSGPPPSDCS